MAVFLCPQCRYKQPAADKDLGKIAKCPKCEGRAEVLSREPDQKATDDFSVEPRVDNRVATEPLVSKPTESPVAPRSASSTASDTKVLILTGYAITALLALSTALDLLSRMDVAPQKVSAEFHPTEWEYRIETPSDSIFTLEMNGWGREGWELISARRATGGYDVSYEVILKRPVKSK